MGNLCLRKRKLSNDPSFSNPHLSAMKIKLEPASASESAVSAVKPSSEAIDNPSRTKVPLREVTPPASSVYASSSEQEQKGLSSRETSRDRKIPKALPSKTVKSGSNLSKLKGNKSKRPLRVQKKLAASKDSSVKGPTKSKGRTLVEKKTKSIVVIKKREGPMSTSSGEMSPKSGEMSPRKEEMSPKKRKLVPSKISKKKSQPIKEKAVDPISEASSQEELPKTFKRISAKIASASSSNVSVKSKSSAVLPQSNFGSVVSLVVNSKKFKRMSLKNPRSTKSKVGLKSKSSRGESFKSKSSKQDNLKSKKSKKVENTKSITTKDLGSLESIKESKKSTTSSLKSKSSKQDSLKSKNSKQESLKSKNSKQDSNKSKKLENVKSATSANGSISTKGSSKSTIFKGSSLKLKTKSPKSKKSKISEGGTEECSEIEIRESGDCASEPDAKCPETVVCTRKKRKKKTFRRKPRRKSTFGAYRTFNDREMMSMHHPMVHARVRFENRRYCGKDHHHCTCEEHEQDHFCCDCGFY